MKTLTSKQYLKKGGLACPKCQSERISSGSVELDGPISRANVVCRDCGSVWTDIWKIAGYDNLNENKTTEELKEIEAKICMLYTVPRG